MPSKHTRRFFLICTFFMALIVALLWRVIDLTIFHRQFLQGQSDARSVRLLDIPAYRGIIMDRNGSPLAVSTQVESFFVNPKLFLPSDEQLKILAHLTQIPKKILEAKIAQAKNREFLYLVRHLPPMLAKQIHDLGIPGLHSLKEYKRYYPAGESAAQLVGFTNVDDQGIEGVEYAYQQWLVGVVGKRRVLKDRMGNVIEELGVLREQRSGDNLTLSIDKRIQYLAYQELQSTVEKFQAKSGSVVVLDASNGEILAVANTPSFNPNARKSGSLESYRNRAFTDIFEPGSVIKPFSIASALHSKHFQPNTIIDTRPGWMVINGQTIRDVHNYGVLDVTGVLKHSSNVGITKMLLASPAEHFIDLLKRCGFGQRTESNFPGESDGGIIQARLAKPFALATLGFGYGLSVTAVQLAHAYSVFANEGSLIPISLLKDLSASKPLAQPVIDKKIAKQVLNMMEQVLDDEGTGRFARVPGYRVAGKTGTSRLLGKKGYTNNRHLASFVGLAPVSNPKIVVAVVVHEPTKISYYGAMVAAPLFAKVMGGALRLLEVPFDKKEDLLETG